MSDTAEVAIDKGLVWGEVKALRAAGRVADTLPQLERLCAAYPDDPRFALCAGEALVEAGRLAEAAVRLRRAVQLDAADAKARKLLGRVEAAGPGLSEPDALLQELQAMAGAGRHAELIARYHQAVRERPQAVAGIERFAPVVNAAGAALYQASGGALDAFSAGVVEEVRERGIAQRSFAQVFGDTALLQELQAVVAATTDWTVPGKPHFFKAIRDDALTADHPIGRTSLHPKLLEVANGFYGLFARMVSANIVQTRTDASPERRRKSSEGWHRDPEDTPMFKAFIYLNDVLEIGHGPFQYIPDSRPGGKYERLLARFGRGVYDRSYKTRPDGDQVDAEVAAQDIVTMLGPAGTMFFCDTSGFHRGGYCLTQDRYMAAYVYQRPGSQFPSYVQAAAPEGAPTAVRMALAPL